MRQVTDLVGRLLVDAGLDEAQQETVLPHHTDRTVASTQNLSCEIRDPL